MTQSIAYKVFGEQTIHCVACEQRIDHALRRLRGVRDVRASSETQQIEVTLDPAQVAPGQVQARLEQIGYQVTPEGGTP
jgi:copper chaperone CopZ